MSELWLMLDLCGFRRMAIHNMFELGQCNILVLFTCLFVFIFLFYAVVWVMFGTSMASAETIKRVFFLGNPA